MIVRKESMRVQHRENIRGGNGIIECIHLLEKGNTISRIDLCVKMTLLPGHSIGLHPHGPDAEIYYIVSGELLVNDDGDCHLLRAGDVMFTTNYENHSVENISGENAELLAIVIP